MLLSACAADAAETSATEGAEGFCSEGLLLRNTNAKPPSKSTTSTITRITHQLWGRTGRGVSAFDGLEAVSFGGFFSPVSGLGAVTGVGPSFSFEGGVYAGILRVGWRTTSGDCPSSQTLWVGVFVSLVGSRSNDSFGISTGVGCCCLRTGVAGTGSSAGGSGDAVLFSWDSFSESKDLPHTEQNLWFSNRAGVWQ